MFGSDSLNTDAEIIQIGIEIMLRFNATKEQFVVRINDRDLIQAMVTELLKISQEKTSETIRLLDKFNKLSREDLQKSLIELGANPEDWDMFFKYMNKDEEAMKFYSDGIFADNAGIKRMQSVWKILAELGYSDYFTFAPDMVRGFDYYDGIVFEVFDKSAENTRSLFGGGRYNGLAGIFGKESFPAVGCAPGDETTKLFLEQWGLIPDGLVKSADIYVPLLSESLFAEVSKLATKLRAEGNIVLTGVEEQRLGKALDSADKNGISKVAILGEDEVSKGIYQLKDMGSGEQVEYTY